MVVHVYDHKIQEAEEGGSDHYNSAANVAYCIKLCLQKTENLNQNQNETVWNAYFIMISENFTYTSIS